MTVHHGGELCSFCFSGSCTSQSSSPVADPSRKLEGRNWKKTGDPSLYSIVIAGVTLPTAGRSPRFCCQLERLLAGWPQLVLSMVLPSSQASSQWEDNGRLVLQISIPPCIWVSQISHQSCVDSTLQHPRKGDNTAPTLTSLTHCSSDEAVSPSVRWILLLLPICTALSLSATKDKTHQWVLACLLLLILYFLPPAFDVYKELVNTCSVCKC